MLLAQPMELTLWHRSPRRVMTVRDNTGGPRDAKLVLSAVALRSMVLPSFCPSPLHYELKSETKLFDPGVCEGLAGSVAESAVRNCRIRY